jgi:hypothetical protein
MPSLREMVMEMLAGRGHDAGEVDIDIDQLAATVVPSDAGVPRENMFKESSFDLLHGLEVSEEPMDTMPDELIEVFLKH